MKIRKSTVPVVILIAVLVGVIAISKLQCSGKRIRKPDSPGSEPRVRIRQKYVPGKYIVTRKKDKTQRAKNNGERTAYKSVLVVTEMDVSEPDAKGHKTIITKYRRIKIDANGVVVDTDNLPPDSGETTGPDGSVDPVQPLSEQEKLGRLLAELMKVRFVVEIGANEEVLRVSGFDEMWKRISKTETDPEANAMAKQFAKGFGNDSMKEMMRLGDMYLPSHPVGIGAVWHHKVNLKAPIVGEMTYEIECELTELRETPEGKIAKIEIIGNVETGGDTISAGGVSIHMKLTDFESRQTLEITMDTAGLIMKMNSRETGEAKVAVSLSDGEETESVVKFEKTQSITTERIGK